MMKTKVNVVDEAPPSPGSGINADESAMLKETGKLLKSQTSGTVDTTEWSTGKAKGASPYGGENRH